MAKVLPCTNAQLSSVFVCHRSPPGQGLPSQQCDSHLDNFRWLCHPCHFAKLLDVKSPACQLLGVPIILLRFFQFNIRAHQSPWTHCGWWCWWSWWWCLLCCCIRSMPPLHYFVDKVFGRLWHTQWNMSDLVIQVLIWKLHNIRHISSHTSMT